MDRRLSLHRNLRSVFEKATGIRDSERRVLYQPPASFMLSYPCILYKLNQMPPTFANNYPYQVEHQYELTVIDREPNSTLREEIAKQQKCTFVRSFESDNLHHYVFHIYD